MEKLFFSLFRDNDADKVYVTCQKQAKSKQKVVKHWQGQQQNKNVWWQLKHSTPVQVSDWKTWALKKKSKYTVFAVAYQKQNIDLAKEVTRMHLRTLAIQLKTVRELKERWKWNETQFEVDLFDDGYNSWSKGKQVALNQSLLNWVSLRQSLHSKWNAMRQSDANWVLHNSTSHSLFHFLHLPKLAYE